MLRKTISVIIMFFAMICVLSAENVKNSSFFLELNKPGESYISFIDLIERVHFFLRNST